jgi:hypothetical protein
MDLVSCPPDVVVSLFWGVPDKLRAGVDGALREDVGADLPSLKV